MSGAALNDQGQSLCVLIDWSKMTSPVRHVSPVCAVRFGVSLTLNLAS